MTGKIIGNLSVGLTQLVVWLLFGAFGVGVLMRFIPQLQNAQIDSTFLIIMVFTFLPAFVMIAAIMAALGATATETREAQQIAGIFTIPIAMPFWFSGILIENPNSPFAIFLSLFPFTAPISLPLRAAFTNIPTWQLILTILLLISFAIGALWLAGRAFRLGMLQYGKRLSLKELFQKA
jgi:ABC-2 type transport system permease protein